MYSSQTKVIYYSFKTSDMLNNPLVSLIYYCYSNYLLS